MNHKIRKMNVDYLEQALSETLKLLTVMAEMPSLEGAAASIVRDDLLLLKDSEGAYVLSPPAHPGIVVGYNLTLTDHDRLAEAITARQHLKWEPWFALVARICQREGWVMPQSFHFRWKERWEQNMSPREAVDQCRQLMAESKVESHECQYQDKNICIHCGKPPA